MKETVLITGASVQKHHRQVILRLLADHRSLWHRQPVIWNAGLQTGLNSVSESCRSELGISIK